MAILIKRTGKKPAYRKLRGYAFDPSLSLKIDTADINDIIYKVAWEDVSAGPVGEYLEVIDYDPTTKTFYLPVDLHDEYILAQDGLSPSESNPQFHQQMVYAVIMTTIKNFEKALGRKILWAPRRVNTKEYEKYVPKLRVYPHAFRDANAYYSPLKKSLLFGYFSSTPADETLHMPDSLVFTCLSHDIIAHETTHAILDGMHGYFNEATNPDMLAFHEAFADIVALFQHFTFPEVLKHQIARTKGDLSSQNLLGQLAQEFGTAIGSYGSLRDAIGEVDDTTGKWRQKQPDPDEYRNIMEPHERGSILVAAVFEAFLSIYKDRAADLLRIATNGSGVLPQGELHPDLVNRLATEASKAAGHVLSMCIRALDYCPPVDLTFGDYLRAIITADVDLVADDTHDYRLAFIDAFRRRGIYPQGIKTLSVESLCYTLLNIGNIIEANGTRVKEDNETYQSGVTDETKTFFGIINGFLRDYGNAIKYVNNREEIFQLTRKYIAANPEKTQSDILGLHFRIKMKFSNSWDFGRITGLVFHQNYRALGIPDPDPTQKYEYSGPSFQIRNLRLVTRTGPDGNQVNQVVFSIFQRSGIIYKGGKFAGHYQPGEKDQKVPKNEDRFELRGGCTLIFDLDSQKLKYAISKPLVDMDSLSPNSVPSINSRRMQTQYNFEHGENDDASNEFARIFGGGLSHIAETFAFLHQH